MNGGGKVVCVTGASGYIASWVVKLLLDRGYTVKATVRSLGDPMKTEHLRALEGAEERLHLFEANLVEQGVFDSIIDGCDGVFHTASPVTFSVTEPQVEILDPAVKGTLNILRSCANAKSVKRVVFTSSIVAVIYHGKVVESDVEIDETWFSDPKFCEDSKLWYVLSKTLAEGEAWKFTKEKGIDLVTMNPCFVIGPLLQPTLNLTCEGILDVVKDTGKKSFYEGNILFVDVRDVAYAHIQAYENPSASGRYLVVGTGVDRAQLLNMIQKLYPDISLVHNDASSSEEQRVIFPFNEVSNQKVKTLGVRFIPLEVSIKDTIESFKDKKFITF